MTLAMVGKLCISAAYQSIYLYLAELYPTELRTQGMGAATMAASVGSIISPYITNSLVLVAILCS